MTQDNAPSLLQSAPETSAAPDRQKATWEPPEFRRIGVHEAEIGGANATDTIPLSS